MITLGGVGELPTVAEGAAYTEMTWDDHTETATFVKKGGYLGLTIEAIDKDDICQLRAAPRALAQAAWMTLGKSIAAVFTSQLRLWPRHVRRQLPLRQLQPRQPGTTAFSHTAYTRDQAADAQVHRAQQRRAAGRPRRAPSSCWVPVDLEATAVAELATGEGLHRLRRLPRQRRGSQRPMTARMPPRPRRVITCPFWTDTNNWVLQADPRLYPASASPTATGGPPRFTRSPAPRPA